MTEKKKFFSNINTIDITDNKHFWKTVKPFFTDKIKTKPKITLIKKKCLPGWSRENSFRKHNYRRSGYKIFNKFSINIVPNLKISTDHDYDNDSLPVMTKLQTL